MGNWLGCIYVASMMAGATVASIRRYHVVDVKVVKLMSIQYMQYGNLATKSVEYCVDFVV